VTLAEDTQARDELVIIRLTKHQDHSLITGVARGTDDQPSESRIGISLAFASASSAAGLEPATIPQPAKSRI
jgi:hypothetical protein